METLWLRFDKWGSFPETVNERAARVLAATVAMLALASLLLDALWIVPLLALGFWLRVWSGPRWDPLARVAVWAAQEIAPRREVAGPPKRFAQLLGALLTSLASIFFFAGLHLAAGSAMMLLFLLASLEALGGICLGCRIFAVMIGRGWVPESICERCRNIS